ncbi:MAG TPA: TIR domain-containing protein [Solirubrobacterales bacterium]|nr:TIR domain-containing protein [Solirubrobacterales bacterium]
MAPDDRPEGPVFDVCLSFAGEQRSYVELVARGLKERHYAVFYDADEQADLWGKNLAEHFEHVYRVASRACVMFISKEYAEKPWTKHERRSALSRALEEDEYVLPARFDDTELPGLGPTIGYIDLAEFAPATLVDLLAEKLGEPQGTRR